MYNIIMTDTRGNHTLVGQTDTPAQFMLDYWHGAGSPDHNYRVTLPDDREVQAIAITEHIFYTPLPIKQVDMDALTSY